MARIPLTLHLDPGDLPRFEFLFESQGEQNAAVYVTLDGGVTFSILAPPRDLRAFADQLVYAADLACKAEDALTDEPLPFEAAS